MTANPFVEAQTPITLNSMSMVDGEAMYRYYRDHRGFDAAVKGAWQEQYAEMLDHTFDLKGKRVLDLGAAMGAITLSMQERGADVWGIEINPYFVAHSPFEAIRGRLLVGDALDVLSMLRDGTFDFVHASQVLEHIAADRQPLLMTHIARVLCRGRSPFFAALPMGEPPAQGVIDGDDATHVCLRPAEWWEALRGNQFRAERAGYEERLQAHPMYQQYQWAHFIWERGFR